MMNIHVLKQKKWSYIGWAVALALIGYFWIGWQGAIIGAVLGALLYYGAFTWTDHVDMNTDVGPPAE